MAVHLKSTSRTLPDPPDPKCPPEKPKFPPEKPSNTTEKTKFCRYSQL